jgi:hypothetical protein
MEQDRTNLLDHSNIAQLLLLKHVHASLSHREMQGELSGRAKTCKKRPVRKWIVQHLVSTIGKRRARQRAYLLTHLLILRKTREHILHVVQAHRTLPLRNQKRRNDQPTCTLTAKSISHISCDPQENRSPWLNPSTSPSVPTSLSPLRFRTSTNLGNSDYSVVGKKMNGKKSCSLCTKPSMLLEEAVEVGH